MAVVKLGSKVKTNLPATIRYAINPAKNDGGRLVYASYSHEQRDPDVLAEPMIHDLERCANGLRKDGVLALHLKHSFSPDEHVSAEQVHELGVMLAEAITGGDYKYVVSTHMDRCHLHNHIVICTAKRRTGRKMRLTRTSIDRWCAISDEICRREGLSVLKNPDVEVAADHVDMRDVMRHTPGQNAEPASKYDVPPIETTGRGGDMGELYAAAKGRGIKERMRILIDLDAAKASSIGEFSRLLDSHGIGLAMRGGDATFTDWATGRRFRGSRLGPAYTLDAIGTRLADGGNMLHLTFNNKLIASVKKTGRLVLTSDAVERGSFLNTVAANVQTLAFDALDAPIAVVGSRNGITPGPEMESYFFPQVSWILDAIHERILPLPGHVPTTKHATEAEIARLNRAGL